MILVFANHVFEAIYIYIYIVWFACRPLPTFENCDAFGRHKTYVVDPSKIPDHITWAEVTQNAGEAMIVFPRVVHYGFNYG